MHQELEVRGRVVNVRPRPIGDFAVLMGEAPNLTWFVTDPPPKLGELIIVQGERERVVENTTVLRHASYEIVPEAYPRRHVPEKWRERVMGVSKRSLKSFQVEGAAWLASRLAERKGAILADEAGLGKTTQTIAAILGTDILPCLVVCPTTLKYNWVREIKAVSKWPLDVLTLDSTRDPLRWAHFVVVGYELMGRREVDLKRYRFNSLVYDEAHATKNPIATGGHRAAVATRISEVIRRTALLTGSPIPNQPDELWRLLHMTEPGAWGSLSEFRKRYCTLQDGDHAIQSNTGVLSRVDEFHALIGPCFLRRQKSQVLDLPPRRRRIVRVDLEPVDLEAYRAAEKDVVAWMRALGSQRAIKAQGRQALLRLTVLRKLAALGKLRRVFPNYVSAWLRLVKRPLVVFGYHRDVMAGAARVAQQAGARVGILSAEVKNRAQIIDAFDAGRYDMLCCPLKLAGVGLNLQSASDVVFLERFWNSAMMDQAESRLHRMGATREVVCTYFDAVGTIDDYIAYIARSKQKLIDHATGDAHAMEIARRLAQVEE